MVESGGVHDEVAASFLDTFGRLSTPLQILAFFKVKRFGIDAIYQGIRTRHQAPAYLPIQSFTPSAVTKIRPHIVVALSCHNDVVRHMVSFVYLFDQTNATLYCVNHNSDYWWSPNSAARQAIEPWINARRFRFISLSPHVASSLRKTIIPYLMRDLKQRPREATLIPVFEFQGQEDMMEDRHSSHLRLAVQGNFESSRRSYGTLFKRYREVFEPESDPLDAPVLNIIGSGNRVTVPMELQTKIMVHRDTAYPRFYEILACSDAILTAFKNDIYFKKKASSTIPAAIIAGVPVIANRAMLKSYTYLDRGAVYLGEGDEMSVAKNIQTLSPLQRSQKRRAVRDLRKRLIEDNVRNMAGWIGADTALTPNSELHDPAP